MILDDSSRIYHTQSLVLILTLQRDTAMRKTVIHAELASPSYRL